MYEELVKRLRERAAWINFPHHGEKFPVEDVQLMYDAAIAIEGLDEKCQLLAETLYAYEHPWTMITSRPMTAEEREEWEEKIGYVLSDDYDVIYTCPLPDDGQEILTCDKYGTIRLDTFEDDPDYGCGLEENGDFDGIVAWMPHPKPPKMDESEEKDNG